MSDETRPRLFPAWRRVVLAVVAGALAGAVAVYVTGGLSGNQAGVEGNAAAPKSVSGADEACAAKAEKAKAVADAAKGDVAALLAADPPQSLATLAFNGPDARPMTLAGKTGKVVLLNLWATWCAPCRDEMPALDALQKQSGSDAFEVVAVNVDTGDDVKPKTFLADTKVETLAYYRDNSLDLFNDLKKRGLALGLPVTLLVDKDGCLLAHMNGPANWAGADARTVIAAAMR